MSRRDAAVAGGLLAVLVAWLLPMARLGVDPHHDGVMIKPALDVLSGQVLFRDTFMQYGALSCYLQALALWFEPTLLSIRLLAVAVYAGALGFLYAAWRAMLPRPLAAVAGLLFILLIPAYDQEPWNHEYWMLLPWSSTFALLFQAIGLYALGRVIRAEHPAKWSLLLGVACACTFWCRQPVGITLAGSLLVAWPCLHFTGWMPDAATRRTAWRRALGGFLLVHGVLFAGMAVSGALLEWWRQNIAWPARWSQGIDWLDTLPLFVRPSAAAGVAGLAAALYLPVALGRARPAWRPRFAAVCFIALAAFLIWQVDGVIEMLPVQRGGWSALIPLAIAVQAAISIRQAFGPAERRREEHYHLVAVTAAVSLASLTQYYPMADTWHVFHALAPALGLFVFLAWRWSGWTVRGVTVLLLALLLPSVYLKAKAIGPALSRPLATLEEPRVLRGMRVTPERAKFFKEVASTLALAELIQPRLSTAMIGDNPLYLCFGRNRENPVPYYVTWRGLATPEVNTRRWAYIQRIRPVLILQKARWEAVDEFYEQARYLPVFYSPAENLEIAFPREIAAAANLGEYGIYGFGRARTKHQ